MKNDFEKFKAWVNRGGNLAALAVRLNLKTTDGIRAWYYRGAIPAKYKGLVNGFIKQGKNKGRNKRAN